MTLPGETFASRVGASLLNAIDMPELVSSSPEQYKKMAIDFARNPDALEKAREKLTMQRDNAPLFDTSQFVAAYERLLLGIAPTT